MSSSTRTPSTVGDGVPWPTYADGTRHSIPTEVTLPDGRTGMTLWVTWVDADGKYLPRDDKVSKARRQGAYWMATVALPDGGAKVRLSDLIPVDES